MLRWLPLVLWVLVLFGVSSIPDLRVPKHDTPGLDKLFHFGEYLVLGVLFARAVGAPAARRALWSGALLGLCVAMLDELYQSTVPGREADVVDAIADVMGAAAGALVWSLWTRRRQTTMLS